MKKLNGLIFGLNSNYTPETDTLFYGRATGIYRLATLLRDRSHAVETIDFFNFWEIDELKSLVDQTVLEHGPIDFIGVGNTFSMIDTDKLLSIIEYIKQQKTDVKIFSGGYGVFHHNTTFEIDNDPVQIYFRGFIDGALDDLETFLLTGKFNPFTTSLAQNKLGVPKKIVDCNKHYQNFDLSRLRTEYKDTDSISKHEALMLETCRGCIFKCKFCSFELIGKNKNSNYIRQKEDVKAEIIDNYKKWGSYKYMIADDTFNDNPLKVQMLYEISQEIDFDLEFWCFARVDLLHHRPEELEKMVKFGVKSIFFGIETLNETSSKIIGKGFSGERLKKYLLEVREKYPNLNITGSFIIGLPKESKESVIENITWAYTSGAFDSLGLNQLYIPRKIDGAMSHSANIFSDDWEKYGYREMPNDDSNMGVYSPFLKHRFKPEDSHQYIKWENEYMNVNEAIQLADMLIKKFNKNTKSDHGLVCFSNNFMGGDMFVKNTTNDKYKDFLSLVANYKAKKIKTKI